MDFLHQYIRLVLTKIAFLYCVFTRNPVYLYKQPDYAGHYHHYSVPGWLYPKGFMTEKEAGT